MYLQCFSPQLLEEEYTPENDREEVVDSDEGESEGVVTPVKTKVSLSVLSDWTLLSLLSSYVCLF